MTMFPASKTQSKLSDICIVVTLVVTLILAQVVNYLSRLSAYNGSYLIVVTWTLVKCPPFPLRPEALRHWVDISGRLPLPMLQTTTSTLKKLGIFH